MEIGISGVRLIIIVGNMTGTINDIDKCFLSIFLKFEPVSPDFNDRYSCMSEFITFF